ncbi:hypothetical protein ACFL7E_05470 [Thermodesulfobacteriota bacterium]
MKKFSSRIVSLKMFGKLKDALEWRREKTGVGAHDDIGMETVYFSRLPGWQGRPGAGRVQSVEVVSRPLLNNSAGTFNDGIGYA